MFEFVVGYDAQNIPGWLADAISNGAVTVKGSSTSEVRYYHVNGQVAGPEQTLMFDGNTITVKG
ncbi:hypothetical protein pEaSNUABM37_00023 [Erwinia phage pEa_SNUABM_37]|nr:hypothetical protein pEaSNUABM37_00023 [Erwinia phage pEa_SNUABM_37]QXO10493.1 hypothetical protein pEaSNUABM48_00023 [Erwinia phage pEa_SNUABM_48]